MMQPLVNHPAIDKFRELARNEGIRIPPKFLYGLESTSERIEREREEAEEEKTLP